jgi:hypothetical protein
MYDAKGSATEDAADCLVLEAVVLVVPEPQPDSPSANATAARDRARGTRKSLARVRLDVRW